jgi:hypothetical protein
MCELIYTKPELGAPMSVHRAEKFLIPDTSTPSPQTASHNYSWGWGEQVLAIFLKGMTSGTVAIIL